MLTLMTNERSVMKLEISVSPEAADMVRIDLERADYGAAKTYEAAAGSFIEILIDHACVGGRSPRPSAPAPPPARTATYMPPLPRHALELIALSRYALGAAAGPLISQTAYLIFSKRMRRRWI